MPSDLMKLRILMPFKVYAEKANVLQVAAETPKGSFGLLPNRLDCVTALVPGILSFETQEEGEVYIAIDEGVLVKLGRTVLISVRNAIGGADLTTLEEAVEREFLNRSEDEQLLNTVMAKMESSFMHRLKELSDE